MRARNLKPGYFKNEYLGRMDPLARILFVGLWCLADRRGRLEDRPLRIKAEVLPYDNCDVDALLTVLAETVQQDKQPFIIRYDAQNQRYIQIVKFEKHQNPHIREAESVIPAPDKHCASPVPKPGEHPLTPSFLNPESSNTGTNVPVSSPSGDPPPSKPTIPSCPHKEIVALWNELLPELPQIQVWNGSDAVHLRTRWREAQERQSLEWWRELILYIRGSPFLMGENKESWQATLGWVVKQSKFNNLLNGMYHRPSNTMRQKYGEKGMKNIRTMEAWLKRQQENDSSGTS